MMNRISRIVTYAGLFLMSANCSQAVVQGGPGTGGSGEAGAAGSGSSGQGGSGQGGSGQGGSGQGGSGQGGSGQGGSGQGGSGQGGSGQGGSGQGGGSNACGSVGPGAFWSSKLSTYDASLGKPLVDSNGAMFLTGSFTSIITFGSTTLNGNGSQRTTFISKLDAMGDTLWARSIAGVGEQTGGGRALDPAGHLWIAGGFYNSVDFGGNPLTTNGSHTGFLADLNGATGNHMSSRKLGEGISGMVSDAAGNKFVHGCFDNTIDLGGGTLVSAGGYDFFLSKLDAAGNHIWSKRFGGVKNQITISADVDAMGNIWLAGGTDGDVDFGGGVLGAPVSSAFVAKLDPSGNHLWSKILGAGWVEQIRIGGDDSVVIMGGGESLDLGNGPLSGFNFLAKLDAQGNSLWSRGFGVLMADRIFDIGVDSNGKVAAVGMVQTATDLVGCEHSGVPRHYLWNFAADGTHLWTILFDNDVYAETVGFDNLDRLLLAGRFNGSVDLGAGLMTSGGSATGFLAKYQP